MSFKGLTDEVLHNTSTLTFAFCSRELNIENITVLKKSKDRIYISLLLFASICVFIYLIYHILFLENLQSRKV